MLGNIGYKKNCGLVVDDPTHVVLIVSSKLPIGSPWCQLSIDVGGEGSTYTWSLEFLSPAAGPDRVAYI